MNYWKEHTVLRLMLMAILFVIGMVVIFVGWGMTGQMNGLLLMVLGLALLLAALYLYNKPFREPKA